MALLGAGFPAAAQAPGAAPAAAVGAEEDAARDFAMDRQVRTAMTRLRAGQAQRALVDIEPVLAAYRIRFNPDIYQAYTSRTPEEAALYDMSIRASTATPRRTPVMAPLLWSDAWYLKGYALIDLKRFEEAEAALFSALELAPRNARYRIELGSVFIARREWEAALQALRQAAVDARDVSPPGAKNRELGRAFAAQGFVQVQQGNLDEAEQLYLQCLQIDPNDQRAKDELEHLRAERARGGSGAAGAVSPAAPALPAAPAALPASPGLPASPASAIVQ